MLCYQLGMSEGCSQLLEDLSGSCPQIQHVYAVSSWGPSAAC